MMWLLVALRHEQWSTASKVAMDRLPGLLLSIYVRQMFPHFPYKRTAPGCIKN